MGQTYCTCIWHMAHSSCVPLQFLSASPPDMVHCVKRCYCRSVGTPIAIAATGTETGTETGIANGTIAAAETMDGREGAAQGLLAARIAHVMSGHAGAAKSRLAAAETMRGGAGAARRLMAAAERMSSSAGAAKSPTAPTGRMSSSTAAVRSLLAAGTSRGTLLTVVGAPAAATSAAERWVLSPICLRLLPASIKFLGQIEGGVNVPYALKPKTSENSGMLCFYVLTGAHPLSKVGSQNAIDRAGGCVFRSAVQPSSRATVANLLTARASSPCV